MVSVYEREGMREGEGGGRRDREKRGGTYSRIKNELYHLLENSVKKSKPGSDKYCMCCHICKIGGG